MTDRTMMMLVRRMEAAGFTPADIRHFLHGQDSQPAKEAAYAWRMMERRLVAYEALATAAPSAIIDSPPRVQAEYDAIAAACFTYADQALRRHGAVHPCLFSGTVRRGVAHLRQDTARALRLAADRDRVLQRMQALVQRPRTDFAVLVVECWGQPEDGSTEQREAVVFDILAKDRQVVLTNWLHRRPTRLERATLPDMSLPGGRMHLPVAGVA